MVVAVELVGDGAGQVRCTSRAAERGVSDSAPAAGGRCRVGWRRRVSGELHQIPERTLVVAIEVVGDGAGRSVAHRGRLSAG